MGEELTKKQIREIDAELKAIREGLDRIDANLRVIAWAKALRRKVEAQK